MKQAQQMQAKMQEAQDKLDDLEVEARLAAGWLSAKATGGRAEGLNN